MSGLNGILDGQIYNIDLLTNGYKLRTSDIHIASEDLRVMENGSDKYLVRRTDNRWERVLIELHYTA